MRDDSSYYLELVIGAEFLASKSASPAERAEHLRMAALYRRRAGDAAPVTASPTLH